MTPESSSEIISRPAPRFGMTVLLVAVALVILYLAVPSMREDWPDAIHPLFWFTVGVAALFGVGQAVLPLVPRLWLRRLSSLSRHRMHIPREGLGYLIIMMVCFAGASMTHSNPLMLVFAAMAGPFIVNGSVTYAMLTNLRVTRLAPPRAMAGELFSVELVLQNRSRLISAWLMTVQDEVHHVSEGLRASVLFTRVARRSEATGHYQLRLSHRGRYRFGPLQVFSRYPLGLFERSCTFRDWAETLVYPRIGRLSPRWKRQLFGATELMETPQNRLGMFDDEFHHLREYRTGDNPRAIHWRSSARRNELIVREYQTNREHDLLLLVDLHIPEQARETDRRRIEQALSVVATLCWEHRRECRGASLTVVLAGRETWRWEASTASSGLDTLLDKLALAAAATDNHFSTTLSAELSHLGPTTRAVAVSTRSSPHVAAAGVLLDHLGGAGLQWLLIDDASYGGLITFDEDRRPIRSGTAAEAEQRAALAAQ